VESPNLWAWSGDPAPHAVRAQLLFAFLLSALLLPFLLTWPPATHKLTLQLEYPPPLRHARFHKLDIAADGAIRLDGEQLDLIGLRKRLETITSTSTDWIDMHPDADVDYERFLIAFAVVQRARVGRLRLDNVRFRDSLG
jgi:biopolymer transport protein ExbD